MTFSTSSANRSARFAALSATLLLGGALVAPSIASATEGTPVSVPTSTVVNDSRNQPQGSGTCAGNANSANVRDGINQEAESTQPNKNTSASADCSTTTNTNSNHLQGGDTKVITGGAKSSSGSTSGVKNSGNSQSESSGTGIGVGGSATGGSNGDQSQKTGILIAPSDNSIRTNTTEIDARVDGRSTPVQQSTVSSPDTTRVNALVCDSRTGTWLPVEILATSNGPRATNTQGGFSVFGGFGAHAGRSKSDTSDIGRKNAEFAQLSSVFAQSQFWQSGDSATAGLAGKYLAQRAGLPVADAEEIGSAFKSAPKVVCGAKPPTSFGPPPTPPVFVVPTYGCFKQPDGSFAIEATKGRQPLARKVCMEKPF